MRQRVKPVDNQISWRQYQQLKSQKDLNFSKIGSINDDESEADHDSQYEYGSTIEEHNISHSESHVSSTGVQGISNKKSITNSNLKIRRNNELYDNVKFQTANRTKSNKKLNNVSSKTSPELVSSGFNTRQDSIHANEQPQVDLPKNVDNNYYDSLKTKLIDRSNVVNKWKPVRFKPQVEVGSDDSDIYEGETTEFDVNESEEFIEEVFENVNTSNPSQGIIKEAQSDEESSHEFQKVKFSTVKNYKINKKEESDIIDYLPNSESNQYNYLSNSNQNRNGYSNFIKGTKSYKPRLITCETKTNEINSTLENKDASTSPDNYRTLDNVASKANKLNDSTEMVNQLKGDTDTLSKNQSEVRYNVRTYSKIYSLRSGKKTLPSHLKSI